jgi:hypothetical protein
MLGRRFQADYLLQHGMRYRDVNDPHYWRAEYDLEHEGRIFFLVCRFDP